MDKSDCLAQKQTSNTLTSQFQHKLVSTTYVSSTDPDRERENIEISSKHIHLLHTSAMVWHIFSHLVKSKALPLLVSKPCWYNKEYTGRPWELQSDENKKWGKWENKSSELFYFYWSHHSREKEGSQRDPLHFAVIPQVILITHFYYRNSLLTGSLHCFIFHIKFKNTKLTIYFCHLSHPTHTEGIICEC